MTVLSYTIFVITIVEFQSEKVEINLTYFLLRKLTHMAHRDPPYFLRIHFFLKTCLFVYLCGPLTLPENLVESSRRSSHFSGI